MGVVETDAAAVVVVCGAIVVVVAAGISKTTATAFDSVLTQNVDLFSTYVVLEKRQKLKSRSFHHRGMQQD